MADIMEMIMMFTFGLSWPVNIIKAWKARTAKGVSVLFYEIIVTGYIIGLISKYIKLREGIVTPWYVWFSYTLNMLMVSAGVVIYYRNRRLDRERENSGE